MKNNELLAFVDRAKHNTRRICCGDNFIMLKYDHEWFVMCWDKETYHILESDNWDHDAWETSMHTEVTTIEPDNV
jgi:hypothetical protein